MPLPFFVSVSCGNDIFTVSLQTEKIKKMIFFRNSRKESAALGTNCLNKLPKR